MTTTTTYTIHYADGTTRETTLAARAELESEAGAHVTATTSNNE